MISVVIPVYNEADCVTAHVDVLVPLLEELSAGSPGDRGGWEIVLVDDGSSDDTPRVLAGLDARPGVTALTHGRNLGKGAALRTGIAATRGDAVLFCDADMSTPPDMLRPFLAALRDGADVVIGNRKSREAQIEVWQPPLRTWLGLRFTWLANRLLGLSVADFTCGFKLFRGDVARRLFDEMSTPGWSFDVEILARAARDGLVIREIPVRWRHDADTRVRVVRDVVRSFAELVSIRRRLGRPPR